MLTLVLGGARSGKSRYAQTLCANRTVTYVATSIPGDDTEMERRVASHRTSRPAHWTTVEAPLALAAAIGSAPADAVVLVDCITVWLSNVLWDARHLDTESLERSVLKATADLIAAAEGREVIAVSNEVGSGVVPMHPVTRLFRDVQGRVNQQLAEAAGRVVWMMAGLPTTLKGLGTQRE